MRIFLACVKITLVFAVLCIGELKVRSPYFEPIPVTFEVDPSSVTATGQAGPDFLWIGTAWSLRIESDTPVVVEVNNGRWKAIVPAGKHVIYHNHDANNTREFSDSYWTDTPEAVVVRKP